MYDPDIANQLPDDAGDAEKGSDGFRLFDGGSGDTLNSVIEGRPCRAPRAKIRSRKRSDALRRWESGEGVQGL